MGFRCFLAELKQLVRLLDRQGVQIHAINGFIKMNRRCAQIAVRAIALPQCIVARERVIGVIEQQLELTDSLIPALLLLIQPA